jgi:hypothetical protein
MKTGRLSVVLSLNSMGPVIDARHTDLLNDWIQVNNAFSRACLESYRLKYPDSFGNGLKFSLFCVSWSGFTSNPVHRDFGWHTVFDNFKTNFVKEMHHWGDDIYWMYNHPAASGVGNEWGLDWFENTHYLNILNHFIIDRAYFPSAIQVPTEKNDTSHFIEQWIPYDFSNRHSIYNNLESVNADGKRTGSVFDWTGSPCDWSHYHPSAEDYRLPGDMKHTIFRIVDIKSIVHVLHEDDIKHAFERCMQGHDTIICAYEHDFRDRYDAIMDLYIAPLHKIHLNYPEVSICYETAHKAAQYVKKQNNLDTLELDLHFHQKTLRINSNKILFGPMPYVCIYTINNNKYTHMPVVKLGKKTWQLPDIIFDNDFIIGVATHDIYGLSFVKRWAINMELQTIEELKVDDTISKKLVLVK